MFEDLLSVKDVRISLHDARKFTEDFLLAYKSDHVTEQDVRQLNYAVELLKEIDLSPWTNYKF